DVVFPRATAIRVAKSEKKAVHRQHAKAGPCFNGHSGITVDDPRRQIEVSSTGSIQHELATGDDGTALNRAIGRGDQVRSHRAAIGFIEETVTMSQSLRGNRPRNKAGKQQASTQSQISALIRVVCTFRTPNCVRSVAGAEQQSFADKSSDNGLKRFYHNVSLV